MLKPFFAIAVILTATLANAQTKSFIDQPYIEVTAQADTLVTPNEIFIKIIISERDTKDKLSLEDMEHKMIKAFDEMAINTAVDLATSDMLSNYKFYLLKQKDVLKSKEYILKVTDETTASKVFLKLEDLGISNSSIDHVDHTQFDLIENICRAKAIEVAKEKAIAMATPLHQLVGKAIYISAMDHVRDNDLQGNANRMMIRGYSSTSKDKDFPPKIEFKKINISAMVSVKFILE